MNNLLKNIPELNQQTIYLQDNKLQISGQIQSEQSVTKGIFPNTPPSPSYSTGQNAPSRSLSPNPFISTIQNPRSPLTPSRSPSRPRSASAPPPSRPVPQQNRRWQSQQAYEVEQMRAEEQGRRQERIPSFMGGSSNDLSDTSSIMGGSSNDLSDTSSIMGESSNDLSDTSSIMGGSSNNLSDTSIMGGSSNNLSSMSSTISDYSENLYKNDSLNKSIFLRLLESLKTTKKINMSTLNLQCLNDIIKAINDEEVPVTNKLLLEFKYTLEKVNNNMKKYNYKNECNQGINTYLMSFLNKL